MGSCNLGVIKLFYVTIPLTVLSGLTVAATSYGAYRYVQKKRAQKQKVVKDEMKS